MFRTLAISALVALVGANSASAFMAPVASKTFSGSAVSARNVASSSKVVRMSAAQDDSFVPDMSRRQAMNLILAGSIGVNVLGLAIPYLAFFVPPGGGGAGGGVTARDAVGNDVTVDGWVATHLPGSRELAEGIKGDATYLTVTNDKKIEDFGIVAVCTHLGCVVPWNKAENKFICPCHGSQYNRDGKV
ncbi:unnamed protein product, partial [Choristocarpus tenellus]